MADSYTGVNLRIEVAPVPDPETFDPATAPAGTFKALSVRGAELSVEGETFAFDPETGDVDSYWSAGEDTISRSWNISFDGYFHPDDDGYLIVENAAWKESDDDAPTPVRELVWVRYYPVGRGEGMRYYEGLTNPAEIGIPSERGGAIDSSYALNGKNKLFRKRVPVTP